MTPETQPTVMITVPVPPSTNELWARVPGKSRVRTPKYNAWIQSAGWEARMQSIGAAAIDCRFDVAIQVPISRRDTDNHIKALLDLMERVAIVSNDGNQNALTVTPTDRTDCLIALTPRPDLGQIRAAPRPRGTRKPARAFAAKRPGMTWLRP